MQIETDNISYPRYIEADFHVTNGWLKKRVEKCFNRNHVIRENQRRGIPTLCIERGFLPPRNNLHGLGWNGLNGRGVFRDRQMGPERWKERFANKWPLQPQGSGQRVYVLGQVPWDASVERVDYNGWLRTTIEGLRDVTDREIVFRPHPKHKIVKYDYKPPSWCKVEVPKDVSRYQQHGASDFHTILEDAYLTVAVNSTAGVESVIRGVPHICFDAGSMAWDVSGHSLGFAREPYIPPREEWVANLAWSMWTTDELADGTALKHLLPLVGLKCGAEL